MKLSGSLAGVILCAMMLCAVERPCPCQGHRYGYGHVGIGSAPSLALHIDGYVWGVDVTQPSQRLEIWKRPGTGNQISAPTLVKRLEIK